MNHVVFFKGKLDVLDFFIDQLVGAVRQKGIDYYVADAERPGTYNSAEFHAFLEQEGCIAFLINNVGLRLMATDALTAWEAHHVPVYSLLVDHPRNFDDVLSSPIREYHALVLDRNHIPFVKEFFPKVEDVRFLPNGGTSYYKEVPPYEERTIDILYTGSAGMRVEEFPEVSFLQNHGADFYKYVITMLFRESKRTTEEAIQSYFQHSGEHCEPDENYGLMMRNSVLMEAFVRRGYKQNIMRFLDDAEVGVTIFGDGWEEDGRPFSDRMNIHPKTSPKECNRLVGEAKIALNFMPWYKDGCSERVFNNMLNGAVCVTDSSKYLEERFTDWENIVFFDLNRPAELVEKLRDLLAHPKKAAEIAQNGYAIAICNDTWAHRLDTVLAMASRTG